MLNSLKYAGIFPIFLICILAVTSNWVDSLIKIESNVDNHQIKIQRQQFPDYRINNFQMINIDENGVLKSILSATKLEHFDKDNLLILTLPRFSQIDHINKDTLTIHAENGTLLPNTEDYHFTKNVKVNRQNMQNIHDFMNVETDQLYIYPKLNKIYSSTLSKIQSNNINTIAGNFTYRHDLKEITMANRIKTTYQPNNQ